jgi:nucleotide-binding universal stress UspA family protein
LAGGHWSNPCKAGGEKENAVTHQATSPRQCILVGLDGSPLAEAILEPVRVLATRLGAEVALLHVVAVPESVRAVAASAGVTLDEVVTQERERARTYLDRIAHRLRETGLTVRTATAAGEAAVEIERWAAREHVDLIALATHGRSGLGRWLYGSVADAVLHSATTPLLLVRPGGEATAPFDVRRVLVALDGSELAEAVLPIAERLARAFAVPLVLTRVVETSALAFAGDPMAGVYIDYQRLFEMLSEGAAQYLETRADELRRRGLTVTSSVPVGTAADALVEEVRAQPGTLLVLGTHGRSGWRAVALGSVARRVVVLAPSAVLLVRVPA